MTTNLRDLSSAEVYEFLCHTPNTPIKPNYLDCEKFTGFSMDYDQDIIDYECGLNKLLVVQSPNFPNAGKGLISDRPQTLTAGSSLPYWGQVFIHFYKERSIDDIPFKKEERERLVVLPFQPFLNIGIELYILGSQSSVATYSNDAKFTGWNEECKETIHSSKKTKHIQNNCFIWCSKPADPETIGGLIAWLKSCPVWIMVKKNSKIRFGEELLTDYFD